MKIKKLLSLLLSAALLMTPLAACGSGAPSASGSGTESGVGSSAAPDLSQDTEEVDTGDASLDDPRNQDQIGEKELLVVSFGHNDANRAKAERYVPADAFGGSLRPFWDAARRHGAVCIFASPVAMREFDEAGVCHPSFAAYREAMRAFAAEVGAPFIDLGAATAAANTAFGAERCKTRYMWVGAKQDNAHQQNAGACRTAQAFVQQLLQDTTPALDVLRANFK